MSGLTLVTAPTVEPLSLPELKDHLRLDQDDTASDADILAYRLAIREWLEQISNRSFINTTWDETFDGFPRLTRPIYLQRSSLVSVTSITYTDSEGNSQTWDSANYTVDTASDPSRIAAIENVLYPDTQAGTINTMIVRYVAGYGSTRGAVPESVKAVIRLGVSGLYENREPNITGTISTTVEALGGKADAITMLMANERVWALA